MREYAKCQSSPVTSDSRLLLHTPGMSACLGTDCLPVQTSVADAAPDATDSASPSDVDARTAAVVADAAVVAERRVSDMPSVVSEDGFGNN